MVIRKKPNSENETRTESVVKVEPGYLAEEVRKARIKEQQDFGDYIERRAITVQQFIDEMLGRVNLTDLIVMEADWLRPIFIVRAYSRGDGSTGHAVCVLSPDEGDDDAGH